MIMESQEYEFLLTFNIDIDFLSLRPLPSRIEKLQGTVEGSGLYPPKRVIITIIYTHGNNKNKKS